MIKDIQVSVDTHCISFGFTTDCKYLEDVDASVQFNRVDSRDEHYLLLMCSHNGVYKSVEIYNKHLDLYSDVVIIPLKHAYIVRVYKSPRECVWVNVGNVEVLK